MSHKILGLFENLVTPEKMVIYRDAVLILLQQDPETYELFLDNFYDSMFNSDSVSNIMDFDEFLLSNIRGIVEEYGVFIDQDHVDATTLQPLVYIAKMFFNFETYEDGDEICKIIESDCPPNEIVAEIVASLTEYNNVSRIMEIIDSTSAQLLKRMHGIAEGKIKDAGEDAVDINTESILRLQRFCTAHQTRAGYELMQQGYSFGLPFEKYAGKLVPESANLSPRDIAVNLYVASILANVPEQEAKEVIGNYINTRWSMHSVIMLAAARALNNLTL